MEILTLQKPDGIIQSSPPQEICPNKRHAGHNDVFGRFDSLDCTISGHSPNTGRDVGTSQSEVLEADALTVSPYGLPLNSTPPSPPNSHIKAQVQSFWENAPCDSWFSNEKCGTAAFYRSVDEHRYRVHRRLQSAVGFEKTKGLRVLEIGCGCGSEAERFARAGARYTAVDLTNAAVSITQKRFQLAELEGHFVQGDAENLPFADGSFDLVYSHGVLHHTPDTPRSAR